MALLLYGQSMRSLSFDTKRMRERERERDAACSRSMCVCVCTCGLPEHTFSVVLHKPLS